MSTTRVAGACALALSLLAGGCSTMRAATRAATNSEARAYASEDAPLTVVVHRAQAAKITADEVERLLTATAADEQSAWPDAMALAPEQVADAQQALGLHPHYDGSRDGRKWRVASALVWAQQLPTVKSTEGASPSLLAAISPELGAGYAAIDQQLAALTQAEAEVAKAEEAAESDGLTPAEKESRKARVKELKAASNAIEARIEPMRKEFAARCRAVASKVSPQLQSRFGVALVNLRQAVRDAQTANTAALVRYPMVVSRSALQGVNALHTIKDDVEEAAKAAASDYVFERTGKRVAMRPFNWGINFKDGGGVGIDVNGLSPSDIGGISIPELVQETTLRATSFATGALTLLVTTNTTEDRLDFEADVLGGILDGFSDAGYKAPDAAKAGTGDTGGSMFGNLFAMPGKK